MAIDLIVQHVHSQLEEVSPATLLPPPIATCSCGPPRVSCVLPAIRVWACSVSPLYPEKGVPCPSWALHRRGRSRPSQPFGEPLGFGAESYVLSTVGGTLT